MNIEIEQFVKKTIDIYEDQNLILELDILFVNTFFPQKFSKGIRDVAWVLSGRSFSFNACFEGESIGVSINRSIYDGEAVAMSFRALINFLREKDIPVRLKIMINSSEKKFGIGMIQLKHNKPTLDEAPFIDVGENTMSGSINSLEVNHG